MRAESFFEGIIALPLIPLSLLLAHRRIAAELKLHLMIQRINGAKRLAEFIRSWLEAAQFGSQPHRVVGIAEEKLFHFLLFENLLEIRSSPVAHPGQFHRVQRLSLIVTRPKCRLVSFESARTNLLDLTVQFGRHAAEDWTRQLHSSPEHALPLLLLQTLRP